MAKILHINSTDKAGGAAIAAFRHNEALNLIGHSSKMLVIDKSSKTSSVIQPAGKGALIKLKSLLYSGIAGRNIKRFHPYAVFSNPLTGFNLADEAAVKEADLIVLHWVCNSMLSIKGVEQILKLGKPVIWFLHDMWPLTGGCHYSLSCNRYETQCHNCPMLYKRNGSDKRKDISYHLLKKKLKKWSRYDNLRIMAPSQWLADCAARSAVFKNHKISVFRNVINTDIFKPLDKKTAREALNLPFDKKLILFGADSINSPYKGWEYLKKALNSINDSNIECVVFGNSDDTSIHLDSPIKINYVGRLNDDLSLVMLYNACDLFVTPSIADNYPNVILESMACGLPCVGFNIGGIPEMIQHKNTGYISDDISSNAILDGIRWVLNNTDAATLSKNARTWVIENSSYRSLTKNIHLTN